MREKENSRAFDYARSLFAQEDLILQEIQREAESMELGGMSLNSIEAKVLYMLIRLRNVKKVVEIGTFLGYSALWMARGLPAEGKLYTLEKDEERAKKARKFLDKSEVGSKVEILLGPAEENLLILGDKAPFDMVFIDGNKGGYFSYLKWAEENLESGGLIVGDNTFLFGAVYGSPRNTNTGEKVTNTMKEFNSYLADSNKFESIMLPTAEGMTIAIKK